MDRNRSPAHKNNKKNKHTLAFAARHSITTFPIAQSVPFKCYVLYKFIYITFIEWLMRCIYKWMFHRLSEWANGRSGRCVCMCASEWMKCEENGQTVNRVAQKWFRKKNEDQIGIPVFFGSILAVTKYFIHFFAHLVISVRNNKQKTQKIFISFVNFDCVFPFLFWNEKLRLIHWYGARSN